MRTTLTIDDDVAAWLERVRAERELGFKEAVNEALRLGLDRMERPPARRARGRVTRPVKSGGALVPSLDNIADVLRVAEGEAWK